MFTPFALELYRRHMAGETFDALSLELRIPKERIEGRIEAAAAYIERQRTRSASTSASDAGSADQAA